MSDLFAIALGYLIGDLEEKKKEEDKILRYGRNINLELVLAKFKHKRVKKYPKLYAYSMEEKNEIMDKCVNEEIKDILREIIDNALLSKTELKTLMEHLDLGNKKDDCEVER